MRSNIYVCYLTSKSGLTNRKKNIGFGAKTTGFKSQFCYILVETLKIYKIFPSLSFLNHKMSVIGGINLGSTFKTPNLLLCNRYLNIGFLF